MTTTKDLRTFAVIFSTLQNWDRRDMLRRVFILIFSVFNLTTAYSQDEPIVEHNVETDTLPTHTVIVNEITVTGNKKTKQGYILREVSVKTGDSLPYNELREILNRDEEKIFNLRIFEESTATIIEGQGNIVDIEINVRERWFLWPFPIFRLADRNFNAWWNTRERDFSRLIYGITLDHSNIRGRGERLRLTAQFGFTRNFQLFYQKPYIDKDRKFGLAVLASFTEFKNLAYQSRFDVAENRNEFDFLSTDKGLLREVYNGAVAYNYRPNFFTRHGVTVGYQHNNIADTIAVLNPEYLLEGRDKQRAFWMAYTVIHDNRDLTYYPLKGSYFNFQIQRLGLGIFDDVGIWSTEIGYTKLFDLGNEFYFGTRGQINASAPFKQPFINQQRLGFFRNFVRGYELSVVEGPVYVLNRNTVRKKIFSNEFKIKNFTRLDQFAKLPLSLYLTAFLDTGWAERYPDIVETNFNNTLLLGAGMGLDIVTFYDVVIRLELSHNLERETNFFLNVRAAI